MTERRGRKRHSPEQIIAKLREADAMLGSGASIGQVCQKLEVSEQTYHRWRNQYGGMKASEARRLLRDRTKLPPASRKIELIPPEELALAVGKVVADAYGIDLAQVSGAALKLLGFGRASNGMRSQIEPVVARMIAEGMLEQHDGQLLMASPKVC